MSSVNIIISIIVLLGILVCYAFIMQSLKQKREQRNRILAALKSRCRNFKFMLNGFPQGFLPRDLLLLVQRSLIDVCEQLAKLEPREPSHVQDLQMVSTQMAETQRHAKPVAQISLDNPQQLKEVKICLEELHRFIHQLETRTILSHNQAEGYRAMIKQLVLQITVDGYVMQGKIARQSSKTKLAFHYFDLALKLLLREGKAGQFTERIENLKTIQQELLKQLELEHAPVSDKEQAEAEEIASEWDKFDSDEEVWKKKHAYD